MIVLPCLIAQLLSTVAAVALCRMCLRRSGRARA